ncbi:MAG: ATP-binding protein [Planctomycetota bacterium]
MSAAIEPFPLFDAEGIAAPRVPGNLRETGIEREVLLGLLLKVCYTSSQTSTELSAARLLLPIPLIAELLEELRRENLVEMLGSSGPLGFRFTLSQKGRDRALRAMEVSGYVGPAPVSLEAYTASVQHQAAARPAVVPEKIAESLSGMTLTDEARMLAGLAVTGNRSLFVYGPAGNGKTSICLNLRKALTEGVWIPHCIAIEQQVIRIFDAQVHETLELPPQIIRSVDHRWVRVRPPVVVVGGELRLEDLDLAWSPSLRFYEAPIQLKSNCGILLIDDFGRQRVDARELLNRWIVPMEYHIDYLTLQTGQKICVPVRNLLMFATNLDPKDVTDPAFLRRMGYRLNLTSPTPEQYCVIFRRYAERYGITVGDDLLQELLGRYRREQRELRCSEPRDLIERMRDFSRYYNRPLEITPQTLDVAWRGFFGSI